jgi:hypothetical protein
MLFEKLIFAQLTKKLHVFYGTRRIITVKIWDMQPCSLVQTTVSEAYTATIIRAKHL